MPKRTGNDMEENQGKMQRFFTACDELITGKFILADTKIGELLRAIATCDELRGLFAAVTAGFDYPAAKKAYLKEPGQGGRYTRGEAYLPAERSEILAFVFCLLADFDSGAMKFNDFLLRYFYEDGSYTASYALFADRVIRPFRDIVRDCYPDHGKQNAPALKRKQEENRLEKLAECISLERTRVAALSLGKEDAIAAEMILNELYAAVGRGDYSELKALLCGYLYFLQVTDCSAENSNEIFRLAGEL